MPTSTPNGMVNGSTGGIASANSWSTMVGCSGCCPTSSSKSRVHAAQEDDERRQQRAQHRAREDLAKDVAAEKPQHRPVPYRAMLRRRNHRQLRQLLFHRMQFQIVDQDGGRHHAGLGRDSRRRRSERKRRRAVQILEDRAVVARRQNVFQRARVEAAEAQAAHQFFATVRITPCRPAAACSPAWPCPARRCSMPAHFVDATPRRGNPSCAR